MIKIPVKTSARQQLIDITDEISSAVTSTDIKDGIVCVFTPHTTAGVTINENADPDVVRDLLLTLGESFPKRADYRHMEGNSDSHIKSSLVGRSLYVILEQGRLQLGTWQSVYFAEFDGPRSRQVWVKVIGS